MITLSDKEQLLLQAALMNLSITDLSNVIDFEKVATITGHANKGVARTMFRRMMVKIASGDQPTPTTSKSRKRKVNDMADKDDEGNAKGTKKSRAKAYPVAEESSDEERNDFKAKIKREHQSDALESQ